jgi:hypothetical protein
VGWAEGEQGGGKRLCGQRHGGASSRRLQARLQRRPGPPSGSGSQGLPCQWSHLRALEQLGGARLPGRCPPGCPTSCMMAASITASSCSSSSSSSSSSSVRLSSWRRHGPQGQAQRPGSSRGAAFGQAGCAVARHARRAHVQRGQAALQVVRHDHGAQRLGDVSRVHAVVVWVGVVALLHRLRSSNKGGAGAVCRRQAGHAAACCLRLQMRSIRIMLAECGT